MNWIIKHKLRRLKRLAEPDREFLQSLEQRLELNSRRVYSGSLKLGWTAASVAVILAGIGATGAYAYASDDVLPGTPLYPIRITLEGLESRVSLTDESKVAVGIKHLKRRLAEDEAIAIRSGRLPDARLEKFHSSLNSLIDRSGDVPPKESDFFDKQTAELAERYIEFSSNDASATRDLVGKEAEKLKSKLDKLDEKRQKNFAGIRSRLHDENRK